VNFLENLCSNVELMLRTENVTVNGNVVKEKNYTLKIGDIVRVANGHYIINSKQMAIVE
jgi:ribosomal protein S4